MRTLARLAALAVCLHSSSAHAQDSQYWTLQYGPVAELLGGVVVGSTRDLSATYYNPGALALAQDPAFVASVRSFEATWIDAKSPAPVVDLSDSSVRPSPSLFAVALPRRWTGDHTLALSALTRQDFDVRVDSGLVAPGGQASAESLFEQDLNEKWIGVSWAHTAGEDVGLGVTTYMAYRGQRTRREISGEVALSPTEGGSALLVEDFDFSNYRLLWKAGLAMQRGAWDLGITVTTPSVRLFGSGTAFYTVSTVGADLGQGPAVAVSAQREEDLESRYQSPWAVAAGASYRTGVNRFHATAEWFGAVAGFSVLDPAPFVDAPDALGLRKRLHHQARSVLNFGFGYERKLTERTSLYGAFTTDFTFAEKGDSATSSLSTWDIYHLTAGASLMVGDVKLTMGAAYAFGSDSRPIDTLSLPVDGVPVLTQSPLDVKFSRVRVLVGFDFGR